MDEQKKETRNTKQKQLILDCLKNCGVSHMTVEEIYENIKKHDEHISIATIYRNLKLMEEQNIVKKIIMEDDAASFFELSDNNAHAHHHLVCTRCGTIIDFDEDLLDSLEKTIQDKKGFMIKDHRVVFYGICKSCMEILDAENEQKGPDKSAQK